MSKGLRKGIIAGVAIALLTAGFIASRIDLNTLKAKGMQGIRDAVGVPVEVGDIQFSFLRGPAIILTDASIQHPAWRLQSPRIEIGIDFFSALSDHPKVSAIYLNDARLQLTGELQQALPSTTTSLDQLLIRDGHLISADGEEVFSNVMLDVRNIGPDRELRWEVLTKGQDNLFSGHGQVALANGVPGKSFGKVKLEHLPLFSLLLHANIPKAWRKTHVSGALTFDMSADHQWSSFGELHLIDTGIKEQDVILRGKLNRDLDGNLSWKDAFVHLSPQSVISTSGTCDVEDRCESVIQTNKASIRDILLATKTALPFSGNIDTEIRMSWAERTGWAFSANGKLDKLSVAPETTGQLPEMSFSLPSLTLSPNGKITVPEIVFSDSGKKGDMKLSNIIYNPSGWQGTATLNTPGNIWLPVASAIMTASGNPMKFEGAGILKGEISAKNIRFATVTGQAKFNLDVSDMRLNIGEAWKKIKATPLTMHGSILLSKEESILKVDQMRLADSFVKAATWWHQPGKGDRLSIKGLNLDFTRLRNQKVQMPQAFSAVAGKLTGWLRQSAFTPPNSGATTWLANTSGNLRLMDFSYGSNAWAGNLSLRHGIAKSRSLQWRHGDERAKISGYVNFGKNHANINIENATARFESMPFVSESFDSLTVRGQIKNARLSIGSNILNRIDSHFRLQAQNMTLTEFEANTAGGSLYSNQCKLIFEGAGKARFSGQFQASAIRIQKISGLTEQLSSRMAGKLYANIFLEGALPLGGLEEWRGNGDIDVYRGQWQPATSGSLKRLLELGMSDKPLEFDKASLRLRLRNSKLDIKSFNMQSKGKLFSGNGEMTADGKISIAVSTLKGNNQQEGHISGKWPEVEYTFQNHPPEKEQISRP